MSYFLKAYQNVTRSCKGNDFIVAFNPLLQIHCRGTAAVVSCDEELNHFMMHNEIRTILGESSTPVVTSERHRQTRSMLLAIVPSAGLK